MAKGYGYGTDVLDYSPPIGVVEMNHRVIDWGKVLDFMSSFQSLYMERSTLQFRSSSAASHLAGACLTDVLYSK